MSHAPHVRTTTVIAAPPILRLDVRSVSKMVGRDAPAPTRTPIDSSLLDLHATAQHFANVATVAKYKRKHNILNASAMLHQFVSNDMRCSYRSKPCHAARATKMNGEFHKLCEYHRRRANLNQQRVHQRRKLRELSEQQALYRISVDESTSDIELELGFECEPSTSPCGDLPLPDLEILELLLSDNVCLESDSALQQPRSQSHQTLQQEQEGSSAAHVLVSAMCSKTP